MAKKEKRFVKTYSQESFTSSTEIWVDRETGVNYMVHNSAGSSGITPLLNPGGTPIITPVWQLEEE